MARVTKTDTAANFGKNDDQLKEFAKGEDVGHGVDHDCPACRTNRQALAKAGLHASDVKGLEGGKAPAGDEKGQPPQARTAFVDTHPLPQPPLDMLPADGVLVNSEKTGIMQGGDGGAQSEGRADPSKVTARHVRLLTLSTQLDESLIAAMIPRGLDPLIVEFDEQDLSDAIVDAGGRFMLMNGFMPDNRDWHVEIGFGAERAAVHHPNKGIAIRLCALLALDPKAGAPINSGFKQLLEEEKRDLAQPGQWSGQGVQP